MSIFAAVILHVMDINTIIFDKTNNLDESKDRATAICFFMVSHYEKKDKQDEMLTLITTNTDDDEDWKKASETFNKMKLEEPEKVIILMGLNPKSIIKYYEPSYRFPKSSRTIEFARTALMSLKDIVKLVENDLQEEAWLYTFGYAVQNPRPTKIKWLGTKENLRQFLALWFKEELSKKRMKFKEIQRLVPLCFDYKDGEPMHLSKPREENSGIPELIEKIFRPNENS